jgi:transposase InsO family protein
VPQRRYAAAEKTELLATLAVAHARCPQLSRQALCGSLGLPRPTWYRWHERAEQEQLEDRVVTPHRAALPPTPMEVAAVCAYAEQHPLLGYKRLAWDLVDEEVAYLRPWMVHDVLDAAGLLGRRQPPPEGLRRPAEAERPDQRWHTDLMMLYFGGRWFWLVDVLDAYSRYLVHCEVLLTARSNETQFVVQRALETLAGRERRAGEPEIVHDNGPQFLAKEWLWFVREAGMTDVRTRAYHPQSNGRDERWHRTLREEVIVTPEQTLLEVQQLIETYRVYYNERRPHSALRCLRPIDYYRGDPAVRLAKRQEKLRRGAQARALFWSEHR